MMNFTQRYKEQQFKPNFLSIFLNPFYFIRKRLYKAFVKETQFFQGKILDFGCGSKPYKNLFHHCDYIGLDYIGEGHDHSKEDIDVYYDGKSIPFEENSFDHIFSSEVFEHIFNLDEILEELYRVLKPGGSMLFSIPFSWYEHEIPNDFARYSSYGIAEILTKHKFHISKQYKTGHFAEALWQLWVAYVYHCFETKNKYVNLFFTAILISPFTIIGICILWIFPKNNSYFHNQVLLVKKN